MSSQVLQSAPNKRIILDTLNNTPDNIKRVNSTHTDTLNFFQESAQPILAVNDSVQNPNAIHQDKTIIDVELYRKSAIVNNHVETASNIIELIWANFPVNPNAKGIPLRLFLQEALRRSRTTYATLQTALYYLFRIKLQITSISPNGQDVGRMFLSALVVASKYSQDSNLPNSEWSKIIGLPTVEINTNEICFLKLIDYNLFISEKIFKRWSVLLIVITSFRDTQISAHDSLLNIFFSNYPCDYLPSLMRNQSLLLHHQTNYQHQTKQGHQGHHLTEINKSLLNNSISDSDYFTSLILIKQPEHIFI